MTNDERTTAAGAGPVAPDAPPWDEDDLIDVAVLADGVWAAAWRSLPDNPCAGSCMGCGAGSDEPCDESCGCHDGAGQCDASLRFVADLLRAAADREAPSLRAAAGSPSAPPADEAGTLEWAESEIACFQAIADRAAERGESGAWGTGLSLSPNSCAQMASGLRRLVALAAAAGSPSPTPPDDGREDGFAGYTGCPVLPCRGTKAGLCAAAGDCAHLALQAVVFGPRPAVVPAVVSPPSAPYRCPGCNVRGLHYHRCERNDGAWMGDPPCECPLPGCFGDTSSPPSEAPQEGER